MQLWNGIMQSRGTGDYRSTAPDFVSTVPGIVCNRIMHDSLINGPLNQVSNNMQTMAMMGSTYAMYVSLTMLYWIMLTTTLPKLISSTQDDKSRPRFLPSSGQGQDRSSQVSDYIAGGGPVAVELCAGVGGRGRSNGGIQGSFYCCHLLVSET